MARDVIDTVANMAAPGGAQFEEEKKKNRERKKREKGTTFVQVLIEQTYVAGRCKSLHIFFVLMLTCILTDEYITHTAEPA